MKKKRGRAIAAIIFVLLVAAVIFWLMRMGPKFMKAEITSSNGSHYLIELPSDLQWTQLNDNASLQYADHDTDLDVIVIDESKAKIISFGLDYDLETYMKIASRSLDSAGMYVNKPVTINGNNALQTEIRRKFKGKNVTYRLTCIETPKFFYQLRVQATDEEFLKRKDDIAKIIASFRESEK